MKPRTEQSADGITNREGRVQGSEPAEQGESQLARATEPSLTPTRLSGAWTAVVVTAVLLVAFVIFVAQNSRSVQIAYLGARGHVPTAVLVLASAAAGALLVIAVGVARLAQVHRRVGAGRRQSPVVTKS